MSYRLSTQNLRSKAIKITLQQDGKEVARAYIFLIFNDLHDKPYALLEDVFVQEEYRGKGLGKRIVREAIEVAKRAGCYKIIATARFTKEWLVPFYESLGLKKWGYEFRMDLG